MARRGRRSVVAVFRDLIARVVQVPQPLERQHVATANIGRFEVIEVHRIAGHVVRRNGALTGIGEQDATVIRFGRQMFSEKKVDSATFKKAVELFGQRGTMDLVAVMSTYAVSGFYAIAVDEPDQASGPFPAEFGCWNVPFWTLLP